jgi:cell wall-associated NlpC family hydrolase
MTGAAFSLLQPGDVVAVRTGGMAAWWIRFGSALHGGSNLDNHVLVIHHADAQGTLWGIEGRPGGVGWVQADRYFTAPYGAYAVSNSRQPKTPEQRKAVTDVMKQVLGTPYDWDAIAQDAARDLGLPELWGKRWKGQAPGHVVCSSAAAWAYRQAGLAEPDSDDLRHCEPSDWTDFCLVNGYSG